MQPVFPLELSRRRTTVGFGAFFVMLLGSSVLSAPMLLLAGLAALLGELELSPSFIVAALLLTLLAQLATIFWGVTYTKSQANWRGALLLNPVRDWRTYAFCVSLGICLFLLLQIIGLTLLRGGIELADSDTSTLLNEVTGPWRFITLGILTPIVVPFVEELFFRGMLFNFIRTSSLRTRYSPRAVTAIAVAFSSLAFALAHLQVPLDFTAGFIILYILIIALTNCWIVTQTNSILPSFALHLGYNLFTVIAMLALTLS